MIDPNDPVIRGQVERAMADPTRMLPSERAALERAGFVAAPRPAGAAANISDGGEIRFRPRVPTRCQGGAVR
jgi:hypothetical protein